MITEDEAFWAGIAVAVMMLGGGFSMLFILTLTGYGAVVLSLGLMTMALTIQMRAKPIEQYETPTPYESRILAPTPIESPTETEETQPSPESPKVEAKTEQQSSAESAEPEPSERAEPTPPIEQPANEPPQPQQPQQPQAPAEEKTEPPKIVEKPKEEPQVVAAAT